MKCTLRNIEPSVKTCLDCVCWDECEEKVRDPKGIKKTVIAVIIMAALFLIFLVRWLC